MAPLKPLPLFTLVWLHHSEITTVIARTDEKCHIMPFGLDEDIIGVTLRDNIANRYARFFGNLPPCTTLDALTELEVPPGKLPGIRPALTDPLAQQQPVVLPDHNTNTNMGSLIAHRTDA